MRQINYWLTFLNPTFGSQQKSPMQWKLNFNPWYITMKMWSSQHSTTGWLQGLFHTMFWTKFSTTLSQLRKKRNMVSFMNYASDLFQVEVSHLYDPKTLQFTLIVHIPLVSNANLLELYEFLPLPIHFNFPANVAITPDVGQNNLLVIGHSKSFQTISSSDLHHASTSETPSFAREGK